MKKTMIALTLMMFVGSMTANVYAASTGTSTEIVNKDEKKKAKKAKKGKKGCEKTGSGCCAGKKAA